MIYSNHVISSGLSFSPFLCKLICRYISGSFFDLYFYALLPSSSAFQCGGTVICHSEQLSANFWERVQWKTGYFLFLCSQLYFLLVFPFSTTLSVPWLGASNQIYILVFPDSYNYMLSLLRFCYCSIWISSWFLVVFWRLAVFNHGHPLRKERTSSIDRGPPNPDQEYVSSSIPWSLISCVQVLPLTYRSSLSSVYLLSFSSAGNERR